MIYLSKWLIRKYPKVLLVLAGIWIAAIRHFRLAEA